MMPGRGLAWVDPATSGLRGQKSHVWRAKILKPSGARRPRIPPKEARAAALQPDLRDKPKGGQWWRTEHARSLTFTTADPRLPWRPLSSPIPGLFTTRAAIPGGAAPLKRPSGTPTEGRGRATYPQASALAAARWRSATRGGVFRLPARSSSRRSVAGYAVLRMGVLSLLLVSNRCKE